MCSYHKYKMSPLSECDRDTGNISVVGSNLVRSSELSFLPRSPKYIIKADRNVSILCIGVSKRPFMVIILEYDIVFRSRV